MKRYQAFSLLEVMAVIAIVAVLAAIAIPSYKEFIVRSKVSNIMNTVSGLIDQAVAYRTDNGEFPTIANLGLTAASTNPTICADPSSIDSNLISLCMYDSAYGGGCSSCCAGAEFIVNLVLDGDALGLASELGTSGGCGSVGINIYTVMTTDGNARRLCVTGYDSILPASTCYYTCSSSSTGWPSAAQSQMSYMSSNQQCGKASY
jgi:prepilin-type N-terminal cleavage/methylation domain-containing protein